MGLGEHKMATFRASVQYNDWGGTAAADDADPSSLRKYLEDKGLIKAGEFLIAAELFVGESHGGRLGSVSVQAFLYSGQGTFDTVAQALKAQSGPIPVRVVDIELEIEQFVALFKRFEVTLTRKGLNLEGRDYKKM
jgi:succinate dehydrogenase/fumarate reductase flavoprotein subunit